jgi:hypothetical protein
VASRQWTWDAVPHDADLVTQRFTMRTSEGRQLGVLEVSWTRAAYHDAVLPTVDVACHTLAERLEEALQHEPTPAAPASVSGTQA